MNIKNTILIIAILYSVEGFSQIAIGKTSISSPSVSLEFGSGNRGVILPWINAAVLVTGAVNGTLIYDLSDKR